MTAVLHGALLLALTFGVALVAVPTMAGPAAADVRENCEGEVVERGGRLVCVGGESDPGDPGDSGDPDPGEQPQEGDTRTGHRYESCTVNNSDPSEQNPGCGAEVRCDGDEEPTNHYTRPEVYREDQGWTWTGGGDGTEAGDGWFWQETLCRAPREEYVPSEADVWRAVRDLQFPGAELEIQPPDGRTLVDFDTNFYTTSASEWGPREVPVGPASVQVRAVPRQYRWDFGDGSDPVTTESPGSPHPNSEVVHQYSDPGTVTPSVTVLYEVHWQYGDSGWQPFDDLLPASASPTSQLEVVEKVNRLVG